MAAEQLLIEQHDERIVNLEQVTSSHDAAITALKAQQKEMLTNFKDLSREVIKGNEATTQGNKFLQNMVETNTKETYNIQNTLLTQNHERRSKNDASLWRLAASVVSSGGFIYLLVDKFLN